MTPRQRRNHFAGLGIVATAPRKSYLGRFTPLAAIQSAWIKSLLTVWGDCVGGKTRAEYRLANSRRLWGDIKESGWSDKQLSRITEAISQAHKEGFRGAQATARAKTLLWGANSVSEMLEASARKDDADFIEKVMLKTFKSDDPVYMVGMQYYTTRNKISDISRDLQSVAPWLTTGEARKRVRWCLEIFRARAFLSVRREIDEENQI
ncbi:hypothetical protein FEI17_10405 [Kosakonia radicincitans]|uniref:hypothetical protein n=1 Tax=Kosakonia radicincitans TaxID=283686 RepID=UPI0011EC82D5|nr:hypothetical protein [Kosakonia radicincitans]QEM91016.1 hypothetical protein FEI17_10405 [Kosakonia radicincitans]